MKITVIINYNWFSGNNPQKDLVKEEEDLEIRGQEETIRSTALLRSVRYREESWRLEKICCHSNTSEKRSANVDVKISQKRKQFVSIIYIKNSYLKL